MTNSDRVSIEIGVANTYLLLAYNIDSVWLAILVSVVALGWFFLASCRLIGWLK